MLYTLRKFLYHYASATLIDVLHSPFVFELHNRCFKSNSIIQVTLPSSSSGYFNKRVDQIIKKLKIHFREHYFTQDAEQVPANQSFILWVEDNIIPEQIQSLLKHAHNDSMVIVRNMYHNREQTQNWEQLKQLPQVTASIDLFFMGLVFVRKEQRKQEFKLRLF